ncbi:MAG: hypothetical protein ACRC36_19200 [Lacrimispora sphenoides]
MRSTKEFLVCVILAWGCQVAELNNVTVQIVTGDCLLWGKGNPLLI